MAAIDNAAFAADLEQCIRTAANRAAASMARWGDGCIQGTTKVDVQAQVLGETITPFEARYGYQAANWCAFYSTRMGNEGGENNPQPNNPQYAPERVPLASPLCCSPLATIGCWHEHRPLRAMSCMVWRDTLAGT
jgi:hypothetical protein